MVTRDRDAFARVEQLDGLSGFRLEFYDALTARADGLFELVDALLCANGPVSRWRSTRSLRSIGAGTAPYGALPLACSIDVAVQAAAVIPSARA